MNLPKKKKPRKGFTRSRKAWEESIATHIGKIIDNLTGKDIVDIGIASGLAYLGYQRIKQPSGLLYGPICLRLATSMNIVAGTAGTIGLIGLGLPFVISGLQGTAPMRDEEEMQKYRDETGEEPSDVAISFNDRFSKCPEGYFLSRDGFGELICMPKSIPQSSP